MVFEYLAQYATFKTVAEMDENVEKHMAAHYYDLTESERAIVFHLASRSLAYPGASHLKAETIADKVGVSTKTVYRSVKKIAGLGIIEKVPGTKRNGIKGANIYRILPNVPSEMSERGEVEKVDCDAVNQSENENQSFNSFNLLKSSNTLDTGKEDFVDKSAVKIDDVDNYVKDSKSVRADIKIGLRDKMPTYLYDTLSPYFNLDDLYQVYGALIRGKAYIDKSIMFETYEGLFKDAVLSVINAYKRGVVRNIFAVMYAAARDTSAQIIRREVYSKHPMSVLFKDMVDGWERDSFE